MKINTGMGLALRWEPQGLGHHRRWWHSLQTDTRTPLTFFNEDLTVHFLLHGTSLLQRQVKMQLLSSLPGILPIPTIPCHTGEQGGMFPVPASSPARDSLCEALSPAGPACCPSTVSTKDFSRCRSSKMLWEEQLYTMPSSIYPTGTLAIAHSTNSTGEVLLWEWDCF